MVSKEAKAETVSWNFGTVAPGSASPSSTAVPNLLVSDLTRGNNNPEPGTNPLINSNSSSNYSGASGSFNAGIAARIGVLNTAVDGSGYYEFTLTPQNGATVSLTAVDLGMRSTSTGPQAYAIRSSLDSYASDLVTGTNTNNGTWTLKTNALSVTGINAARTFRIYGYGGAGSAGTNTSNWRIDDLALTVSVVGGSSDTLSIVLNPTTIVETGPLSTSTATVTRSGIPPFASDLLVTIAVGGSGAVATAPATVTIPLAQASATFTVTAVDDSLADGDQTASVSVSAPAHSSDTETITVQNDGDSPLLLINEYCAFGAADHNSDGTIDQSQDEFVELVNKSGGNLDISNWTISDNNSTRHTFASGTILLTNQAVVVFGGGTVPPVIGNALAFRSSSNQLGLNNTGGDAITIRDSSSTFVTSASYTSDVSAQADSFNLSPENIFGSPYVLHSAVAGAGSSLVSPGRKVDLTEFISLDPLLLSIPVTTVSENGGTISGTVTLPGSSVGPVTVSLLSSDTTEATVPTTVDIPTGDSSVGFTITGVDDIEPDGNISVTISASALGFGVAQQVITVQSDTDAVPPATLAPGAISFVGFNADGADDFAFVALTAIPANTTIRFTDNEWNGLSIGSGGLFNSGEGFVQWTSASVVTAGTVVIIGSASDSGAITATTDGLTSTTIGTVTGTLNLNGSDETLYAYQGTDLNASGFLAVIATHNADSVVGTGLTGSQIVYLPDDIDIGAYIGSRSGQISYSGYLSLIADTANPLNWVTQNTASTADDFDGNAPDVPFDGTVFTISAGGNTYTNWVSTNSAAGGISGDHDNDGVTNGVEFFMGATGSTFTPNPVPDANRLLSIPASATATGVTGIIQTSPDLVTWTTLSSTTAGGFISATIPAPDAGGKIFARLNVVVTTP